MPTNVRTAHATALASVTGLVATLTADQLALPTPCTGWSLRQLLEHMTGQNHGFASAIRGAGAAPAAWSPRNLGPDPGMTWRQSADEVRLAFAGAAPDRQVELAEFDGDQPFSVTAALAFHFLDTVIHGWDVAATLGRPYECDTVTAELLLQVATNIPTGPAARAPGRPFRPTVAVPGEPSTFDRALALTGRDPHWSSGCPRSPA